MFNRLKRSPNQQSAFDQDLPYMSQSSAAVLIKTPRGGRWILYCIALMCVVLIIWAACTQVDEVTRAEGKVIPSSRVQVIQNLEGGILDELYVREGQHVKKGTPLLNIEDSRAEAAVIESNVEYEALIAAAARLVGEANNTPPSYPSGDNPRLQGYVHAEKQLYRIHQRELANEKIIVQHAIDQKQFEIESTQQTIQDLTTQLNLLHEQKRINKPLVAIGAVPRLELLTLEQQISSLRGELNRAKNAIPSLSSALKGEKEKLNGVEVRFQEQAQEELTQIRAKVAIALAGQTSHQDRIARTSISAPLDGTIKKIHITTLGGVIQPGMTLIEIVPDGKDIIVEAHVKPSDIGFVHPGLAARIKISAYDFATYGALDAVVEHVSADTIVDEQGNSFYIIRLRVANNTMMNSDGNLPIIPGMQATIGINIANRSLLSYIFKPVLRMLK
ncbi:adhesin transport system membrane fusion protein [Sinobacterium caligoides]|uniref:Membrane fusion protein (MFP) family protein n=1 Tax=Sinobacterium caligoides TaxID=933926 RepID=A0A3N2DMB7_9GAMM|nr:HlyD family type I secretion periplasmic adaptor subunit [Sinobacterium caligoides]ROS00957.1 adhesin transport system membrane fusion protein [Sinobacterium caligoides]